VRSVRRRFSAGCHKRTPRLAIGLTIGAISAAVTLDPPSWAQSSDTVQNEIRSALEKWQSAFNDRDQGRVCDLFAPDLIANYQGQPQRDFTSLCQLLQTSLQDRDRIYRYSLRINEILVYGDTAVASLVWMLEIEKPGEPKEIVEEPSVDIFRRQADGVWKISRYLAYAPAPR